MSQVLLIESNLELSKVIKLNLMKYYDFDVIEKNDVKDAIAFIEILPSIDLFIVRETEGLAISELTAYLVEKAYKSPLIVVGQTRSNYKFETNVEAHNSWKFLIELSGKLLDKAPLKSSIESKLEFLPVPLKYFLNITETSLGCDVYIRVKKSETEFQYIKRINATDNFKREDVERYRNSGLKDFYIPQEHFSQFVNYATDKLTIRLLDTGIQPEAKLQLSSEVYDVTLERLQSLGIDERTIELVGENLKVMQNVVGEKNAMADYLKLLTQNKLSYAYSHVYLSNLLLNKILKNFEWGSAIVREKITYICYFHDISLKSDHLMKISSKEELQVADLNSKDTALVLNHANLSADIVDQFPQVPMGVSELIRQHHGVKTGVGFKDGLSINLSPIVMMFLVVEEFVTEFLKISGVPARDQLNEIFKKLELVYTKLTYAQTVAALKTAILPIK